MKETSKLTQDIGKEYEALEDPKQTRSYFLKWVDKYIDLREMLRNDPAVKRARIREMLKGNGR